jgi:hypothetical protein
MPKALTLGAAQVLPGWIVKSEPTGNLSFVVKSVVTPTEPPGCVAVSLTASITGETMVLLHAGAVPVQAGSPPPVTVTVLLTVTAPTAPVPPAAAETLTGIVMTIGPTAPDAIEQPAKLVVLEHPLIAPPVAVILAAMVVMPVGNVSESVIAAVVGPLATTIVIV